MKKREFLKSGLLAAGGLVAGFGSSFALPATRKSEPETKKNPVYLTNKQVNKREKVLSVLDQSKPNQYIPAAFFLHFDEKLGEGAVKRHLEFFRATNMDFVKIQYELSLPRLDTIKRPEDWANIPVYGKDFFEPMLYVIKTLTKELKAEGLILPTVYSPFSLAAQTAGRDTLLEHAKENPDAVAKGLENITASILNYVREATALGVDGFYISTQGGDVKNFSDSPLFDKLVVPFDKAILQESSDNTLVNILHICDYGSTYNRIDKFTSYPGSIINPPITLADGSPVTPKEVEALFHRPVMGGLDRLGVIAKGTEDEIKAEIDRVLQNASQNFILAADCTVPGDVPWQQLRAAIDYAHDWRLEHA